MKPILFFLLSSFIPIICHLDLVRPSSLTTDGKATTKFYSIPVYGDSDDTGYYYANFYFGSQHIKQSLIIDTGSYLSAIPCKSTCKECGYHKNYYFNPNLSSSAQLISCDDYFCKNIKNGSCNKDEYCHYSVSFAEGSSLSGLIYKDVLRLGEETPPFEFYFGCHIKSKFNKGKQPFRYSNG